MLNPHNQIICDITKIILEDGVTIYQGYVSVKDGHLYQHFSDDPRNTLTPQDPDYSVGMLKNRKEYERIIDKGLTDAPEGDYISSDMLSTAVALRKQLQEAETTTTDEALPQAVHEGMEQAADKADMENQPEPNTISKDDLS